MHALGIGILIANSCPRWRGIFKGLSKDREQADISKNLHASLINELTFTQIPHAGQYL